VNIVASRWLLPLMTLLVAMAVEPEGMATSTQSTTRWTFAETLPGGNACAAKLPGDEVDTLLMLNKSGELLLIAGRPEWRGRGESQEIELQIDRFEIKHLVASSFDNLVLLVVKDESVLKRLKNAKDLYWRLPSGTYHAAVQGLATALSWLHTCERKKQMHAEGAK
jgi:hypothetical protein